MFDIEKIREDFPILHREVYGRPLVYLDSAATAQKPRQVTQKITELHNELNANIHRSVHYLATRTTEEYENARETVRSFINAALREEIVFTSGATAAINIVARGLAESSLGSGDNVVVSEMEHHSNIVPWQMACERVGAELRVLRFDDDGRLRVEDLYGLLDSRTRIVAVTQASNVLGTVPDLHKIIETAHAENIPVIVDGCQGVVHGRVDVAALGCDFYVFSGHKLYGPTGTGVLYGKQHMLEKLPPMIGGGEMVETVTFEKTHFAPSPLKFEAGTSNFVGAIALAEAIRYVTHLDMIKVAEHEQKLLRSATDSLLEIDGLRIYGTTPGKCPIISFNIEGIHPSDMASILDKLGIAVRSGTHCAEPIMQHYGITGTCRASFALYNTLAEIQLLAEGVKKAASMLR